jgi:hypothetical protein
MECVWVVSRFWAGFSQRNHGKGVSVWSWLAMDGALLWTGGNKQSLFPDFQCLIITADGGRLFIFFDKQSTSQVDIYRRMR